MSHKKDAEKEFGKMLLDVCKYFMTIGIAGQFIANCGGGKDLSVAVVAVIAVIGIVAVISGYFLIRKIDVDEK